MDAEKRKRKKMVEKKISVTRGIFCLPNEDHDGEEDQSHEFF